MVLPQRELASDKRSPCYLILQPYFSQRIHTGYHVLAYFNEGGSLSMGCILLCHTLGVPRLWVQELTSLVGRLNLVTTYSGRRRNFSARCYKRSCEVITVICLQTLETFLPEYEYHYSIDGNNKFVLCYGLGPI